MRRIGSGSRAFTLHLERLDIAPGDSVAITGPSGCGKSTLLGLLSLSLRPDAAAADVALMVDGADAFALWQHGRGDDLADIRGRCLGYVPQTAALLSFLSLRANIALPQTISGRTDPAYIDEIAGWLGIADILDRRPAQVSVGQRQRAAIARALAHRPTIILADEPTASVHPSQADEILSLLHGLATQARSALVVTTHDVARAEAAGFAIAPCEPDPSGMSTSFHWSGSR